jgi:benzoate transport
MSELTKGSVVNVVEVIEETKNRSLQYLVIGMCFIIMLMDGYDNAIISNAAPILMKEWKISAALFGPVFSSATFGWMVGAALIGSYADVIGRKKCLVAGSLLFSAATLLVIYTTNVTSLIILRFITGVGIGAAVPPAIVLTSEFSPSRSKAKSVTIMFSGFTFGGTVGSFIASWLIPAFGWHSMFVVGFIAPLPAIAALIWYLPESPRWLAVKGTTEKHRQELIKIIKKLDPRLQIDANTEFIGDAETRKRKYSVKQLFEGKFAVITTLLWIYYAVSSIGLFFIRAWLPALYVQQGYSAADASYWTGVTGTFGVIGILAVGFFLDKAGFKWGAVWPLLCGVFTVLTGAMTGMMFVVIASVASFFSNGEHSILTSLAPNLYPVSIRAQADSWAIAVARIGSIAGPLVGGVLISTGMSLQNLFYVLGAPFIICTICCYILGAIYEKDIAPNYAPRKDSTAKSV